MARVDVVHDAQGNVHGFVVHAESETLKSGVVTREDQTVTSLEVPGHPAEDPQAFTEAVHAQLRRHLS